MFPMGVALYHSFVSRIFNYELTIWIHFGDPFIETPRCLISWENWWFISEMAMNDVRQWLHCWITCIVVNPTSHWPVLLSCWGSGAFRAFSSLGRSPAQCQGDVLCVSAIETDGDRAVMGCCFAALNSKSCQFKHFWRSRFSIMRWSWFWLGWKWLKPLNKQESCRDCFDGLMVFK